MTRRLAAAVLAMAAAPLGAHRLDEYLQGTILSVGKSRVEAEMTLTPGVIVFPVLIPQIDRDGNGTISPAEQRAYAEQVLRDLSLAIDGRTLRPQLLYMSFPAIDEMREGRGEIKIAFAADLPPGGRNRQLVIENRHQARIAAYQVNCLVPRDPQIRIAAQNRNYTQSVYELDYEQAGVSATPLPAGAGALWLGALALALGTRFTFLWRRRTAAG